MILIFQSIFWKIKSQMRIKKKNGWNLILVNMIDQRLNNKKKKKKKSEIKIMNDVKAFSII